MFDGPAEARESIDRIMAVRDELDRREKPLAVWGKKDDGELFSRAFPTDVPPLDPTKPEMLAAADRWSLERALHQLLADAVARSPRVSPARRGLAAVRAVLRV